MLQQYVFVIVKSTYKRGVFYAVPKSTGDEIVHAFRQRDELLNDLMDRMNAESVDAIVMPASVVPAPKLVSVYR